MSPQSHTTYLHWPERALSLPLQFTYAILEWNNLVMLINMTRGIGSYKFSPGYQAFSGGAHEKLFPDYILDMTEEQRAVMEPPYCRR